MASAIPTTYRGINFRSRLEAKWASFMDDIGWKWEYEPLDLSGYIPDFILQWKTPCILEVKPGVNVAELQPAMDKVDASGWNGPAIVVGAVLRIDPTDDYGPVIGQCRQRYCGDGAWKWSNAATHRCAQCGSISVHHFDGNWTCFVCDDGDGDHYLLEEGVTALLVESWAYATNAIQWMPRT